MTTSRVQGHLLGRRAFLAVPAVLAGCSTDRSGSIVDRLFESFRAGALDTVAALLAADVRFEDPTFGVTLTGRAAVKRMLEGTRRRFPSLEVERHALVATPGAAATEQTLRVTIASAGGHRREIVMRGASFFTVEGGLITRWTDYYDYRGYLATVSLDPAGRSR